MKTVLRTATALGFAALLTVGATAPAHAGHGGWDFTPDRFVCDWFPVFC